MAHSFAASVTKSSDQLHEHCCLMCEENGLNKEASLYCVKCSNKLCNMCAGKHQELFPKHRMLGRDKLDMWGDRKSLLETLIHCKEHTDRKLELFCEDHSKMLCLVCILSTHRQCRVVVMEQKVRETKSIPDLHQLAFTIKSSQEQIEQNKREMSGDTHSIESSFEESRDNIREVRKHLNEALNEALDKMENASYLELDTLKARLFQCIERDIARCTETNEDLQDLKTTICDVISSCPEIEFIAHRTYLDICSTTDCMKEVTSNRQKITMTFKPDSKIQQLMIPSSKLGNLVVAGYRPKGGIGGNKILNVLNKKMYNVKVNGDSKTCSVTCILGIASQNYIIFDNKNMTMKLLDSNYKIVAHYKFGEISESQVFVRQLSSERIVIAINLYNRRANVYILGLKNMRLVLEKELAMDHTCHGIVNHQTSLFASSASAIFQYTMDGRMIKLIHQQPDADRLALRDCVDSQDGCKMLVDVTHKQSTRPKRLITLSLNGDILYEREPKWWEERPYIALNKTGQVVAPQEKNHSIVQFNKQNKTVLRTLATKDDCVYKPQVVYFCERTSSIIVGMETDNIIVIKVQ